VRLIGRTRLAPLGEEGRDTAIWVASWMAELRDADWKHPADISGQFPKAIQHIDGTFLFPVPNLRIGIHVLITFSQNLALIIAIRVLEVANGR
jgi:mRNA-degrading endonuclease HigB of HigAB toxin-antitoxin module